MSREAEYHVLQEHPEPFDLEGSADVETLVLEHSGHNLVVDREWERVAEVSYRFISRYRD